MGVACRRSGGHRWRGAELQAHGRAPRSPRGDRDCRPLLFQLPHAFGRDGLASCLSVLPRPQAFLAPASCKNATICSMLCSTDVNCMERVSGRRLPKKKKCETKPFG